MPAWRSPTWTSPPPPTGNDAPAAATIRRFHACRPGPAAGPRLHRRTRGCRAGACRIGDPGHGHPRPHPRPALEHRSSPAITAEATLSFKDAKPLLEAQCYAYHGVTKKKGGIDLSAYADIAAVARDRKTWQTVAEQLAAHDMPPDNAKSQPSADQRRQSLSAVKQALEAMRIPAGHDQATRGRRWCGG